MTFAAKDRDLCYLKSLGRLQRFSQALLSRYLPNRREGNIHLAATCFGGTGGFNFMSNHIRRFLHNESEIYAHAPIHRLFVFMSSFIYVALLSVLVPVFVSVSVCVFSLFVYGREHLSKYSLLLSVRCLKLRLSCRNVPFDGSTKYLLQRSLRWDWCGMIYCSEAHSIDGIKSTRTSTVLCVDCVSRTY